MSKQVLVWDPLVRILHWLLAAGFLANALIIDDDSGLHQAIGLALVGVVALRIVWGGIGSRHARFADFPIDPGAAVSQLVDMAVGRRRIHAGHSPLGALMIYNLLVSILAIGLTGWMMTTLTFHGVEWVQEAHEALVSWAGVSVALHVLAVFFVVDTGFDLAALSQAPGGMGHFLPELVATIALVSGVVVLTLVLLRLLRQQAQMERGLNVARGALSDLMEEHFRAWGLTPSEADVATFTIKGFSIAEIARLRGSAEATVKTHLNAIYRKSGLNGRGQLVSVLIEDLIGGPLPVSGAGTVDERA